MRFLAEVSHELRTPLTVLRGEVEVALRGISNSESTYRKALELIVNRATDMGRLVEDLLFLARSEADAQPRPATIRTPPRGCGGRWSKPAAAGASPTS